MNNDFQTLFNRMLPYAKQSPYFDFAMCKFGLIKVDQPCNDEVHCELITTADDLLQILFEEVSSDVRDESGKEHTTTELFPEEVIESRRRILPYFQGLPNEAEAMEALEKFLDECL